jgi:hypothetical protein
MTKPTEWIASYPWITTEDKELLRKVADHPPQCGCYGCIKYSVLFPEESE